MKNKNRELFNEAIADAKNIKDMAIANAKQAIAESFTPQIHKMLATKLEEMEQEELDEDVENTNESTNESEIDEAKKKAKVEPEEEENEESTNENVNLDELLAELNEDEVNEEESLNEDLETEAKKADDKKDDKKDSKKDDAEEEDEEIDFESMSETDLEDFIKGVIKDMAASGELEDGGTGEEDETEEEVSIDEILKSLSEESVEEGGSTHKPVDKSKVDAKSVEYYEKAHEKVKEELEEAVDTINEMKKTLNEVNLLNAKLLYTNKIFKTKTLNESQKVKVLNSFDKAKTVADVKIVHELLMENLGEVKKQPIKEHKSIASTVISGVKTTGKKQITETIDPQIARFQKLAGIK